MRSTSRIWIITGLLSGLATILLLVGFVYGVKDILYPAATSASEDKATASPPSMTDQQPPLQNHLDVSAIGDSLAKGTGDDKGLGFAGRTVQTLTEQKIESQLRNNLGINGLKTAGLLEMLEEKGVKHALQQSNVILLSIGGNDLFQGAQALQNGGQLPTWNDLEKAIKDAGENFKKIIKKIKEINPDAQLVYVSLYNPFTDLKDMKGIGNRAVSSWNLLTSEVLSSYEHTLVVPTFDLYVNNGGRYLSSDHFHPNQDGYQIIAERIVQSIFIEGLAKK
ncbi:GDSL-type esterase/lipase family protein [Paenibacillus turicensis]|uniref:GDSL-type esterase/lipase family protein n=1 Tax=Paenibacillus turicensis TaxID=160487 RepID=UPI003D2A3203